MNRALDLRPHRGRAVEVARKKDRLKQRRNLVAIIPQNCTELFLNFGSHLLANEKSIDLSCDKTRRDRLFQDDVDHIHPIEVARVSEKRLGIPVVLLFMNDELQIDVIPASESARRLAHIPFRIVADAHREQFHDLAGKVLIGRALHVHAGVEERQHCGVLRNSHEQIVKISGSLFLEQLELTESFPVIADLCFVHRKVAVPEQRHLFLQRVAGLKHAIRPPVSNTLGFQNTRAQPVEEFIHDRLYRTIPARFDFDAERLTFFLGQFRHGRAAFGKRLESGIVDSRMVERRKIVLDILKVHQAPDGFTGRQSGQRLDLFRSSAKAGPFQKMRCKIVIPIGWSDRCKIILPLDRTASLRKSPDWARRRHDQDDNCCDHPLRSSRHVKTPSSGWVRGSIVVPGSDMQQVT